MIDPVDMTGGTTGPIRGWWRTTGTATIVTIGTCAIDVAPAPRRRKVGLWTPIAVRPAPVDVTGPRPACGSEGYTGGGGARRGSPQRPNSWQFGFNALP